MRLAKRAQRERDREAGLVLCQVKLRKETAALLRHALGIPGFDGELEKFLADEIVEVKIYPNLGFLCWKRIDPYLTAKDAFGLYERNKRFVDTKNMTEGERSLIRKLTQRWGRRSKTV